MVGSPCKERVKTELERLKIPFGLIEIGMVELPQDLTVKQREKLKINLLSFGFLLQEANKAILIEKIKSAILEMILYSDGLPIVLNSIYLSKKLNYDYTYLANIFSEVNGISIQQFIILRKIDVVKELLLSEELNLSKISFKLHYSSVAHLSSQFKKITGYSPSRYKMMIKEVKVLAETTSAQDN